MTDLPTAPEYTLAEKLIAYLRDTLPALSVFEQPWDTAAQNAALAVAARTAHGVVAVSPQPPVQLAEDHDAATGNFRARVAVLVLVQRNVTAADAPKRAAGCMAALLAVLRGFDPQGNGIPYAEPRADGIDRLNAAEYKDFADLSGMVLSLSVPVSYNRLLKK